MSEPSTRSAPSVLAGLGPALRWLRYRRGKKQYVVAIAAGITKGMLSAYETGRQRPSLETLDALLRTLGVGLVDLHNALAVANGRPETLAAPEPTGDPAFIDRVRGLAVEILRALPPALPVEPGGEMEP